MLIDTHAHLDDEAFAADLDQVVERAEQAGVGRILAVGSDLASSRRATEIAVRYGSVYAAVGTHPHHASSFRQEREELYQLLGHSKVVAIGEIGLDYLRSPAPAEDQLSAFRQQIAWARECCLPVSVHNRDADAHILESITVPGLQTVLHCFSGSRAFAAAALEVGCFLSFAGNVTFPRAVELREVAATVPLTKLLTETDSPVLAPQAWRGRRNEPSRVVNTVETLASALTLDAHYLEEQISSTANALFSWNHS